MEFSLHSSVTKTLIVCPMRYIPRYVFPVHCMAYGNWCQTEPYLKPDPPSLTCQWIINATITVSCFTQISLLHTIAVYMTVRWTHWCVVAGKKVKEWSTMKGYTGVALLFLSTILFQGANTQSMCFYFHYLHFSYSSKIYEGSVEIDSKQNCSSGH